MSSRYPSPFSATVSDLYSSEDDIDDTNLSLLSTHCEDNNNLISCSSESSSIVNDVRSNFIFNHWFENQNKRENSGRYFKRCAYLGSSKTNFINTNASKAVKIAQTQEAIAQIKCNEGEHQPASSIDISVNSYNVAILDSFSKLELMKFPLSSISYVADFGDLLIITADNSYINHDKNSRQTTSCHVLRCGNARIISSCIGNAFIEAFKDLKNDKPKCKSDHEEKRYSIDNELVNNTIYQEVDNFMNRANQKEVVIPKKPDEKLGITLVESGWGSMIPTAMIGHIQSDSPALRSTGLNIGDYIMSVNGVSFVGIPLRSCLNHLKSLRSSRSIQMIVVKCSPVTDVFLRRPDSQYPLGFRVQDGVVCSLLRGGIAERSGIRVGHKIIEINGKSLVTISHQRIVNMLTQAVGELRMKTIPLNIYQLLIGQESAKFV
ncbi:hypothetical protein GJ496_008999 [Pomphorhynchus laevis]|nr:hypothetical protein GJ496_008999 [Pomphorhynchus laevis]